MSTYRVFAVDALTKTIIEELPWESISYAFVLNDFGRWSVDLPLSVVAGSGYEKLSESVFDVARSCIVITRDGVMQYAGWLEDESQSIDGDTESLSIGGRDVVIGYMDSRVLLTDQTWVATEQLTIASDLIADNMTSDGIPITIVSDTPGVLVYRDRTYYGYDRQTVFSILSDISGVINGFDFAPEFAGTIASGIDFRVRFGVKLTRQTEYTLDLKKNIKSIGYTKSSGAMANRVSIVGAGGLAADDAPIISTLQDPSVIGTYPIVDKVVTKPTVIKQETLDDHASEYLRILARPERAITVSVEATDPDCAINQFRIGDQFRVIAKRGRMQIDSLYRVQSWGVTVDRDGNEDLTMSLTPTETTS